jgi:hypothetical protein
MVRLRWPPVECRHQVAVGRSGGGEFVVAVLEVLLAVEQLLFEVGQPCAEGLLLSGWVRPAWRKASSPRTSDSRRVSLVLW